MRQIFFMKHTAILLFFIAALSSCNSASENKEATAPPADTTAAAPKEETPAIPTLDSATKAKNAMDFMTPGEMQNMMASMNGKWNCDVTMYMPTESKSKMTMENSMIMGGRFQVSKHKGEMMGQPFEGTSTMGYDNLRKVFTSAWVDNMSTSVIYMEGTYDAGTKTITMTGKATDAETGDQYEMKQVLKVIDDKTNILEMYMTPQGGQEMKFMESKNTKA